MNATSRSGRPGPLAAALSLSLSLVAVGLAHANTVCELQSSPWPDAADGTASTCAVREQAPTVSPFDRDRLDGWLTPVEGLGVGGRLDLRGALARDESNGSLVGPAARLGAWWSRGRLFSAGIELQHRHAVVSSPEAIDGDERGSAGRTELTRAWAAWSGIAGAPFGLTLGRQEFEDSRGWLYHRGLDAVRLDWGPGDVRVELSAGLTPDTERAGSREERGSHTMALVAHEREGGEVAAWALYRNLDTGEGERRLHLGGRSAGSWIPRTTSWLELGLLLGERDDHALRGFAADTGLTWAPRFAGPVDFTLGYAVGSGGGPERSGDDDRTFRQTGWQDNTASVSGRVPLKYYGEALDPELSNLAVVTLGTGARLGGHAIDVLWHGYRQHRTHGSVPGLNVEDRANGLDPDLGQGLDFVYGTELGARATLVAVLASFRPGAAFEAMGGTARESSADELAETLAGNDDRPAPLSVERATRMIELRLRYLF